MINRDLIELQKKCNSTCVVIQNEDIKELESNILIDKISSNEQDEYYQIIKDREFCGYKLPEDMIIVLTVKNKETLKNISQKIYNLCVIAF